MANGNQIHGRFGAFWVDDATTASTGPYTTSALGNVQDWSLNQTRDRVETTALGDASKNYAAGLPDASGTINMQVKSNSLSIYTIADGSNRGFYLYVDNTDANSRKPISGGGAGYWYGTATFDVSTSAGLTDMTKAAVNWSAATPVYRV